MMELYKLVVSDRQYPTLIPVFKGKGDPMECGSYRVTKLLEHAMKVVDSVLEKRIRGQVTIDEMQCGFRPGKGTTDGIFIVTGKTPGEEEFVLCFCRPRKGI
jgi:hypothetical protein